MENQMREPWGRVGQGEPLWAEIAFDLERTTSGVLLVALAILLLIEGVGTLAFGFLTLVVSQQVVDSLIPWLATGAPLLFGLFCLVVAYPVWQGAGAGLAMAAIAQLLVLAGAITGLVTSAHPALWVPATLALVGITLSIAARSRTAIR